MQELRRASFARRLHGRQQQADQDADDGNDHQQFNKRKTPPGATIPLFEHRILHASRVTVP